MLLKGFGFSGYRSIGDDLVKIGPLQKINLIIGQNNVGKSNIINFLAYQYSSFVDKAKIRKNHGPQSKDTYQEVDHHISEKRATFKISFPIFHNEIIEVIKKTFPNDISYDPLKEILKKLLSSNLLYDEEQNLWFAYKADRLTDAFSLDFSITQVKPILTDNEWHRLWKNLTKQSGGDLMNHWIPETLQRIAPIPTTIPEVEVIPAIRKIGSAGSEANDYSGEGIIDRIAKIQDPPLSNLNLRDQYDAINTFVQNVLENPSAKIKIPYERDMIQVHMDGKALPLESLGTGVHEVVILAAAATTLNNSIICIEEPELHLHPLLQRKLIKYLSEKTANQYFFTTHSAHLLDSVEAAAIFHVTMENGASKVTAINSTRQRSNICNDLGYKASDILQANCVIWVEGPSDRIYLNYWLNAKKPDLIEGIHYSIMFYGGRLFSHLTALDQDEIEEDELQKKIEDFVSVRKLNRNSVIMFDSDKSAPKKHLNKTKNRLKAEFNKGPGFTWVTKGREVENYLDFENIEASVQAVHPSASKIIAKGQWENLLKYVKNKTKDERTASKVKVAKYYVEKYEPDFSVLDLDEKLDQLCKFISSANGNEI